MRPALSGARAFGAALLLAATLSSGLGSAVLATCGTDTVVVYGPAQVSGAGINVWQGVLDDFTTTTSWGRRYVVEVVNGTTRVNNLTVSVDGNEWLGASEFGSAVSSLKRIIENIADGNQNHELAVVVNGSTDSYATLRICHVSDPTFTVYGPTMFTKPSPAATQSDSFPITSAAKAPHTLRVINGAGDGTNRISNAYIKLNGVKTVNSFEFGTGIATITRQATLLSGSQQNQILISNSGASGSHLTLRFTATDSTAPALAITSPSEGLLTEAGQVGVVGSIMDETPVKVSINGGAPLQITGSFSQDFAMAADGNYTITVHAANSACLTTDSLRHVARDRLKPGLTVSRPDAAFAPVDSAFIAVGGAWADTIMTWISIDGDTIASGRSGTFSLPSTYPLDLGPNRIVFRAQDALGHDSTIVRFVFRSASEPTPPTLSASTIVLTEIPPFLSQVRFLYASGSPALQTGPGLDTTRFQAGLAAVVRGRVLARDFGGLQNVTVRVLGHDEYGQTLTRADGQFDLVVNGGGPLLLRFLKAGYLEAQRRVDVPINDYVVVDSLALIGQSARRYVIQTDSLRVLVGRFESDRNGDRKLVMLFAPGTRCSVTTAGGSTTTYTTFSVRLKEFTVGSGGDDAMPAPLPPSSAYTYCVDMGVIEADSVAVFGDPPPLVRFDRPVVTYVREFLGIPVGKRVPSGYYDPRAGTWVASEDGVVIRVLPDSSGFAELDTDGDGAADDASRYASLGIALAERAEVATRFAVGDSLWRTRIEHFSARDLNENEAPQAQAEAFNATRAAVPAPFIDDPTTTCGCVIENENRILGESIPSVGTPFTLNYRSNRQPGDKAMRFIRVPLTGPSPPAGLRQVTVLVDIAGRRFKHERTYDPTNPPPANESWLCDQWDGTDAYDRRLPGSTTATVRVGYGFAPRFQLAVANGSGSFGSPSGAGTNGGLIANQDRDRSVVLWTTQKLSVGAPSMASAGLGGWTISPHHFYDVNGQGIVYFGDGSTRLGNRQFPILRRFAGNGASSGFGRPSDGNGATTGSVTAEDLAAGPDGSVHLTDAGHNVVSRVAPDGTYHTIAGTGFEGTFDESQDGSSALTVALHSPDGIALSPDGSVYFAETATSQERMFRIAPDGKLWLFAGKPGATFAEDSLAVRIPLTGLRSVAVGPDGAIFLGTSRRIIRVGANGRARTYAGTGGGSPPGAGSSGRADSISIDGAEDMVCDANGNLYFTEMGYDRVRRVSPDGRLTDLVFRSGLMPRSLAIGPDGAVHIGQNNPAEESVRRVERDSSLSLIAGGLNNLNPAFNDQDGQFALAAIFASVRSIATGPDGALYISQVAAGNNVNGVHKVTTDLPGESLGEIAYPSQEGSRVDYFTVRGQHLKTVDALTGLIRFRFGYDAGGRLTRIYDAQGDSTVIHRDGSGNPTSIVAPYGQPTTLALTNGYLGSVTDPGGQAHALGYYADGLLHTFTNPRNQTWTYTYSASDGRLEDDLDPAGGTTTFTQQESGIARTVTRASPEGVPTRYNIHQLMNRIYRRFEEQADGSRTSFVDSMALQQPYGEVVRTVGTEGETTTRRIARDYRFGWFAPVDSVVEVRLPSGLRDSITATRLFSNPRHLESVAFHGRRFVAAYDTTGREFKRLSPLGRTWAASLSPERWLTGLQWGALDPVSLAYDARGKLTHLGQGWRALRYAYDGSGRVQSVTDTLARVTSFTYDAADRETLFTLPGGREVHVGYDGNGNVIRITPPGSAAHTFAYTGVDLNSTYTPPGIAGLSDPATRYEYNGDRQLTRIERPDTVVTLEYDGDGRLWKLHHTQGVNTLTYTTSPSTGQVRSVTAADGTIVTEDYDGPLRMKESWSGTMSGSVERTFDSWFRDSTQKVNGGNEVTFRYDDDGLDIGAGTLFIHRRMGDGLIDSTRAGTVGSHAFYGSQGELTDLQYTQADTVLFRQQLYRDGLGRIIRIRETVDGQTRSRIYGYDAAGRLATVAVDSTVVASYEYDGGGIGNGNRTKVTGTSAMDTVSATYDAQDRMVRHGGNAYRYTAGGELEQIRRSDSDSTRLVYDPLGNLVRVKTPDGHQLDYLTDGMNRRVGYKVDGVLQRAWLYQDALNPVAELDREGTLVSRYVYGTADHVPDLLLRAGQGYRIVTDYLGSVRAVVDTTTGATAQRIDYDAWGVETRNTAGGFQALGFVGGLTDSATALVRFGARDYEPGAGRWTSKDPSGMALVGTNPYEYSFSMPADYLDIDGRYPKRARHAPPGSLQNFYEFPQTLVEAYAFANTIRPTMQARFPESAERHEITSELIACNYGGGITRVLGLGNEFQGLIRWDIHQLMSRLSGRSRWAFDPLDLVHNELGIMRGERGRRRR